MKRTVNEKYACHTKTEVSFTNLVFFYIVGATIGRPLLSANLASILEGGGPLAVEGVSNNTVGEGLAPPDKKGISTEMPFIMSTY